MIRSALISMAFALPASAQDLSCRFLVECVDVDCAATAYAFDVTLGEADSLTISDPTGDAEGRIVGLLVGAEGPGIVAQGTAPAGPFVAVLPDPEMGGAATYVVAVPGSVHIAYQGSCE